jgi:hypothetical protein
MFEHLYVLPICLLALMVQVQAGGAGEAIRRGQ